MTKIQNPTQLPSTCSGPELAEGNSSQAKHVVLVIVYWNLKFICNLVLGFWDFGRVLDRGNQGT